MIKHIDKIVPVSAIFLSIAFAFSAYHLASANSFGNNDTTEIGNLNGPKILLVPGHDNQSYGAKFNTIKESDLNLRLAQKIIETKNSNQVDVESNYDLFVTRDREGYSELFKKYFDEYNDINNFIFDSKEITANLIQALHFRPNQTIKHNIADSDTVFKLYGINKWVDENEYDLVIHIHFNDYPRKNIEKAGRYNGYSIYIPEKQLANHENSLKFAKEISKEMSKHFSPSNLKMEQETIIESQELIAVGANNTLNTPSILIEYAYIYEDFLQSENEREETLDTMAEITIRAIENYLSNSSLATS